MRYGTGHVQVEAVELLDGTGRPARAFRFGEEMTLEVTVRSRIATANLSISFLVRDMTGIDLTGTTTFDERVELPRLGPGESLKVRFTYANCFRLGHFGVSLAVTRLTRRDGSDNVLFDQIDGCIAFSVIPDPDRPVHYKFHNPVRIGIEAVRDA
jgi:lipopolysaccharide transport system ATP-binding protein